MKISLYAISLAVAALLFTGRVSEDEGYPDNASSVIVR